MNTLIDRGDERVADLFRSVKRVEKLLAGLEGPTRRHGERTAICDRRRVVGDSARQPPNIAGVPLGGDYPILSDMWQSNLFRDRNHAIPRKIPPPEHRGDGFTVKRSAIPQIPKKLTIFVSSKTSGSMKKS